MKIQGYFNDIINEHTYWISVGNGVATKQIQDDADTSEGTEIVCFGADPVIITSDISDTFENIYIRKASINLVTNYDIRNDIMASNYADLPVEIRYDDSTGEVIFFGFVTPLSFNQSFDKPWNDFTLECYDRLGMLEYIKFPPLLSTYDYNTPRNFINLILSQCKFPLEAQGFDNISYTDLQYDVTASTKINPIVFIGESEDDWMTCQEVLEEIGKIYGCYFRQDGNTCVVENVMLYDLTNPVNLTTNDYAGNDTNISIQEAYNRIECQVDLVGMQETLVDPFSDSDLEYVANSTRAERVLSEIIYNTGSSQNWDLFIKFRDIMWSVPNYKNWQQYDNHDENFVEYDHYCRIMQNSMYNFGTHNYLNDGYGSTGSNVYATLEWLHNNPGKGAFLEWSKTDNLVDTKKRSTLDIDSNKQQMLLIQVGGHGRSYQNGVNDTVIPQQAMALESQFNTNQPVFTIDVQNANNFIPNDVSKTNYLVISGKLRLNPLQCRTGFWYETPAPPGGNGSYNTDPFYPWNQSVMSQNTVNTLFTNWANIDWSYGSYYLEAQTMGQGGKWSFYSALIRKNFNDDSNKAYYQHYCWDNIAETPSPDGKWPFNQTPNYNRFIALPYLSMNTVMCPYNYSAYKNSSNNDVTGITKCAVLACELSIGEGENKKYLVENLDALVNANYKQIPFEIYSQIYQWKKLEDCPVNNGVRQTWFTIGVNPDKGDYLLGKELEIQNTVSSQMLLPSGVKGTAIPITSTDQLQGRMTFKILGPYNAKWNTDWNIYHGWGWSNYFGYTAGDRYIMDHVENIQLTNLEIKPYANGQLTRVAGTKSLDDKDLVYYSDTNDIYESNKNYSCKLCTCLTDADAAQMGISFGLSNSTILNINDTPFYGISYKGTSGVKLEQARVSEHYNIWNRPRSIVETTLKLVDPEKAYLKTNYTFNYLKYKGTNTKHVYKTLARDIDLKYNRMTCTMKELSNIPE